MLFISHRGNIDGICEYENTIPRIQNVLSLGYDIEIDIWFIEGKYFLGHDEPKEQIVNLEILFNQHVWVHAKTILTLNRLVNVSPNVFFHNSDDATLTKSLRIWTFAGKPIHNNSIACLPENCNYSDKELSQCYGICSDFVDKYKEKFK